MSAWLIVSVILYALGCLVASAALDLSLGHPVVVRLLIIAWPIVAAGIIVASSVTAAVQWAIRRSERAA